MGELKRSDFPTAFNGGFRPAITKVRCPKCRSRNLALTEQVEAFTTFEVKDGRLNREDGIHELGNFIGGLTAKCQECGHDWRIRGAGHIEDACTELDPFTFKPLYEDTPAIRSSPDHGKDNING